MIVANLIVASNCDPNHRNSKWKLHNWMAVTGCTKVYTSCAIFLHHSVSLLKGQKKLCSTSSIVERSCTIGWRGSLLPVTSFARSLYEGGLGSRLGAVYGRNTPSDRQRFPNMSSACIKRFMIHNLTRSRNASQELQGYVDFNLPSLLAIVNIA